MLLIKIVMKLKTEVCQRILENKYTKSRTNY